MKHLPLHAQHQSLGAVLQECGEWEIPAHYGHSEAEYLAARDQIGLADLSHRGKCLVTGEDRVKWLQSIISQDILPLQTGQGGLTTFMNHKGKILSFFRVYVREEFLFLEDVGEVGDQTFQALKKFLLFGTKAKLHNCLDSWGILLVTGPKTSEVLQKTLSVSVKGLQDFHTLPFGFRKVQGFMAKTQETASQDIEVFIPTDILSDLWTHLYQGIQEEGGKLLGRSTLETLRIEAGWARLGTDVNDQIVPPEANLEGKAFSLSKGCYPGQEVVARMDTYGAVKRRLVGLVVNSTDGVIPEQGSKIYSGTREVGWVSSATFSPLLQKPIALGFPLRDFTQANTALEIETGGTKIPALVSPLPFRTDH